MTYPFFSRIRSLAICSLPLITCYLLLGACFFNGCSRNLVTRNHQVKLISEKTEIEIGKKAKQEIIKQYGAYNDLDWQIYIDQIGQKVAKASDRPNLPYDFTILDTEILNAFSVPGGCVFITRGMLTQMADEAELAVVLGHEITHIAAWHGVDMLQKSLGLSTLTALGAIGGMVVGAGEAALVLAQAASVYENLYLMGYGRDRELEADHYGILYAGRAGYDPSAAMTFFRRLNFIEREEEAGQHISPYWRSHPLTTDRLKRAARWIAQSEKETSARTYNRDKYQQMISRLPQGEVAEKGTVSGKHYDNRPFGLTLDVPSGWQLDNSRIQSLVGFVGPKDEVRGTLQRYKLADEMGVQDFASLMRKQWGFPDFPSRDVEYPAGHGLLWQYGSSYFKYRSLLLVRGSYGYVITCQIPVDDYFQYIVDCEKIMRSFKIE